MNNPIADEELLGYVEDALAEEEGIQTSLEEMKRRFIRDGYFPQEILENLFYNHPSTRLQAVRLNGLILKYMEEEFHSDTIYYTAVNNNGMALKYIPETKRTYSLCYIAVKQNRFAFQFVPFEYKTEDLITLSK